MNIDEIRDFALSFQGVTEDMPFGPDTLVFRINGKIFLLLSLDAEPIQFNVKCNPEIAIDLREQYPSVIPGYHMNKKHWNTVFVDGSIKKELLLDFIRDSYDLVSGTKKKK